MGQAVYIGLHADASLISRKFSDVFLFEILSCVEITRVALTRRLQFLESITGPGVFSSMLSQ
jgi:hypothetical protein